MKSLTISIDPSSTLSGVAIFRGKRLVSVDLIRPKQKGKVEPPVRAIKMARQIYEHVRGQVEAIEPNKNRLRLSVVVEVPGGQGRAYSRGLVTMGMAVGAVCSLLSAWCDEFNDASFEMVLASTWTRIGGGRPVAKTLRAKLIAEQFASWDFSKDKGHDMKDAVGLGAWKLGLIK